MPRNKMDLIPEFNPDLCDPFKTYRVHTHNPKLTADFGQIEPFRIQNGFGVLNALEEDADPDVVQERRDLLQYFQNAHKAQVPVKVHDEEKGIMVIDHYKYEPAYRVEPEAPRATGKARPLAAATA